MSLLLTFYQMCSIWITWASGGSLHAIEYFCVQCLKVITIKHRIQWYICVVLYTCVSIEKWVSIRISHVWVSRYYTHRIAQIYVSYWKSFDWLNCYMLNRKWVRVTLSWALPYVATVFSFCNVCNIKSYTFLVNPRLLKSRFCEHYHCSVQVCWAL